MLINAHSGLRPLRLGFIPAIIILCVFQVDQFLGILQTDLESGVGGRLDYLLGQCMYFGLTFSRVGCDFRGLIAQQFQNASLANFEHAMNCAIEKYVNQLATLSVAHSLSDSGTTLHTCALHIPCACSLLMLVYFVIIVVSRLVRQAGYQ